MKFAICISSVLLGYILRIVSWQTLKGNFSARLQAPNQLITNGIYSKIRHPAYTGSILIYFGLVWFFSNIFIALIFTDFLFNYYFDRADREENMMFTTYKQNYLEYAKRTKMFIPFIL